MPVGVSPDQTVEFSLPADQDLPADQRPTFMARCMTARQTMQAETLMDECNRCAAARAC